MERAASLNADPGRGRLGLKSKSKPTRKTAKRVRFSSPPPDSPPPEATISSNQNISNSNSNYSTSDSNNFNWEDNNEDDDNNGNLIIATAEELEEFKCGSEKREPGEEKNLQLLQPMKYVAEAESEGIRYTKESSESRNPLLSPEHVQLDERSASGTANDDESSQSSEGSESKQDDQDPLVTDDESESVAESYDEVSNVDCVKDSELVIMAGPTTPLLPRRIMTLKPVNFDQEPLQLCCEWEGCSFETRILNSFMEHVVAHNPTVEVSNTDNVIQVFLVCNWKTCPFKTAQSEDLQRHIYLHAYHTKLKCIGTNTVKRANLNICRADATHGNILPDLSDDLICAWGSCSEKFINIQSYYNHIRFHCEENTKGRNVPGGIQCLWTGCSGVFSNIARLRDHVRSHTQEKLLSCPVCGALFSNRTRFFDHCRRQSLHENQNYACTVCMKMFSTARLLRDHIRSHVNTYRCQLCEMSCSSPSALNSHVKYRHSDEKPFQCDTCTYAAKSQCDLARHIKLHRQVTYSCSSEGCSYTSKAMVSMTHHIDKVHCDSKKRKYLCHVCENKFLRGYYLTKHLTSAHGLQWPSGHSRFRYKLGEDGLFRLFTLRYESEDPETEAPASPTEESPSVSNEEEEAQEDAGELKNC